MLNRLGASRVELAGRPAGAPSAAEPCPSPRATGLSSRWGAGEARSWRGPRAVALTVVLAIATGCARDGNPETRASASSGPPPPPPLDLIVDAPWPAPYAADPLWARAARGDDLDQARLARRENADALVDAVQHGGSLARTALRALSYASDRRRARGALCGLIERTAAASRQLLLSALLDAVSGAPRTEETLDPAADALCARALEGLARDPQAAPAERDLAAATLTQLGPP